MLFLLRLGRQMLGAGGEISPHARRWPRPCGACVLACTLAGCLQGGWVFEQQMAASQLVGPKQGGGGQSGSPAGKGEDEDEGEGDPATPGPGSGDVPQPGEPLPKGPAITIRGRARPLANSNGLGHHFGRPGTSFGVRIRGTGLRLTLQRQRGDFDVRFARSIDGVAQPPVVMRGIGPTTLTIAENLPAGDHEIWWTHLGDSINTGSIDQLISLDPAAVWLAAPTNPTNPTRLIEVIGASASTGYGILPDTFGCIGSDAQDPTKAWVELVAQSLGALAVQSATAAMGVWWDFSFGHQWIASKVWPRIDPLEPTPLWDFAAAPKPQVVLVDLTGIDWTHAGFYGLAPAAVGQQYVQAMSSLLDQIWAVYPETFIYLFINNGIPVSRRMVLRSLFDTILSQAKGAGHVRCGVIEAPYSSAGIEGCNEHPTAAAHKAMADQVTAELRRNFSW